MADRKPTVLNPAGYQENLQDTDNLIVEAAPTADNHAVNKGYADTEIADAGKWEESSGNLYPKNLSNNVGIGTDAPSQDLHVKSNGVIPTVIESTDSRSQIQFKNSGGSTTYIGSDLGDFKILTNGNERVRVDFSGDVGIGTYAPAEKLHVKGSLLSECVEFSPSQDGAYLIATGNGYNSGSLGWNEEGFQHRLKANNKGEPRVTIDTPANGESFCVVNNGNVGIGTDDPSEKLTVSDSSAKGIRSHCPNAQTTDTTKGLRVTNGSDTDTFNVSYKGAGYFAGNVTAASFTGPVTGDITGDITGNINGNVVGDVTGDLTGNVTGNLTGDVNGDVTGNLTGDVTGNLTGNVNGNVTGDLTGDVTGNADTATKLKTARNINGTSFDGTSAITTAKWGTARNLNGVSVDGSANKTLEPYVERDDSTNANRYLTFVDNNTAGYKRLNMDTNLSYNPSTNTLNVNISGNGGSLDGLDSTQFLRSDVDDSASGVLSFNGRVNIRGNIDISDNQNVDFGSSDDTRFTYNPDNWLYCNFRTGNGILFQDNGSSTMVLEDSGIFRPAVNNTGKIGEVSTRWSNGYFQDFYVENVLSVRGAIDLNDNDIIRFGTGDDAEFFTNGSHFYLDLNGGIGNFYIRDGTTTRFTFNDNGAFTCTGKLTAGNFDLESLPTLP